MVLSTSAGAHFRGTVSTASDFGLELPPGSRHYRAFVGYPATYDIIAAMQFNLLTFLGLREHHRLLDVGCGSLRAGRLFVPYLRKGHYFGIEPEEWLVREGIERETGQDLVHLKDPQFAFRSDYMLSCFGVQFDFILAQSIFSHAGASDIEFCLSEAAACLAPGGMVVASFVLDRADYDRDEWVYPTCVGYRDATIRQLARSCGLDFRVVDWPHPNAQTWAVFWCLNGGREPNDPSRALETPTFNRSAPELVEEQTGAGFFDGCWDVGEAWLAYGWALDRGGVKPSQFVLVADETTILTVGRVGVERPDVAAACGPSCLRSGFRVRVEKAICPPGRRLRAFAYSSGSEQAFLLSGLHST
jgi:SAM-dependent methyltransferase